jgi:hypothetical protein
MADAQHDGPWGEEPILAAAAAKSEVTPWSDHNGALKYYRDNLPLDTDHTLTTNNEWIKQVVHGVRQAYTFGEWAKWDWRTMIAAFRDDVRRRVIGTGITAVAVSKRSGSYDHHMAVAAREHGWSNAVVENVDFKITRTDGTVLLVHPRWAKKGKKVDVVEPPPGRRPTAIMPDHGPGRSDGPSTYRRLTCIAYNDCAFEPAVAGPGAPVVVGPGTPMVAGPGTPAVGEQPPPPPPPPPPTPVGPAVAGHQPPPPDRTLVGAAVAAHVLDSLD